MKLSSFKTVFILVSFVFALTSCSDNHDDNSLGSGGEYLTVKIDGANFEAPQDPSIIIGVTIINGLLAV